ncbi:uncharacterized protein isoform X2 [Rhodnius prolixus]|uniref:XK-related protein n=3 Tax=Rhodnius TaxID=13248 RepID=T1HPT8_RHOPR
MSEENPNMSVLDTKQSHVLDFPLTVKQQLWLIFVLPAFLISAFYIIDIATDVAIGCALINENHILAGILTLLLLYTAPLISYITSLSNPPPENEFKVLGIWFLLETLAFLLFPLRPLQCFSERIFWGIEALRLEDPLREEALMSYEESKRCSIEHYLFFQGIIHAGPQILLQLVLLILGTSNNPNTEKVQVACMISSLVTLSMITMSYQRYETQVNGGRQLVWPKKEETVDSAPEFLMLNQTGLEIPRRKKWTKIMEEDDPLGKIVLFLFWFLFLLGRTLSLALAAIFCIWAVLGVCIAHYLCCLLYILPTPDCKTNILYKILISFLYIFCLIEVGIQFRKSHLFYILFFTFSFMENLALTILWAIWADWDGWWYHYALYLLGIAQILALTFLFFYFKYFQPTIRRIPTSTT